MDLSDIAMLEAIVKNGSISKASEVLHVTQPTLSKRLSRLEYTLGTVLFDRSSSGLTPTAHTAFIIESSQSIKHKIVSIERHIELMNALEVGDLRLGVGPIVEQLYFPYALIELTKSRSTRINLSIRTEMAEDLIDLLISGQIDLAIGPFEQSSFSDEFLIYPIANQPLMVATRSDHPLIRSVDEAGQITADDMFNYTLVAPHTPGYMDRQFPELGTVDSARIICDNYAVIKELLLESDHFTIGPSAVFSREVSDGSIALLPLPVPIMWYAACITRPESRSLPVIEKVIDTFRRYPLPSIDVG